MASVAVQLALLPSPLLGPAVWAPVAAELRRTGWSVVECKSAAAAPDSWEDVLDGFVADLPASRELVLVPHSNAGLYVPALSRERHVAAALFVDAGLPPADGAAPLAPAAFYDFLSGLAGGDDRLPPWTQWWDDADADGLFPGPAARERVENEQLRLPLAYFRGSVPVPAGWDERPCGYLAFGETYADERQRAQALGWPVQTLAGRHLHTLVKPREVAAAITQLLASLGLDP